jgi:hypothetical protein
MEAFATATRNFLLFLLYIFITNKIQSFESYMDMEPNLYVENLEA